MKIEVTQADIARGSTCSPFSCPIALAARRVIVDSDIGVRTKLLRIGSALFDLPEEAIRLIAAFDTGRRVHPFSFDLPIDHLIKDSRS